MTEDATPQVEELRALLESQLDHRLGPKWGCWPLLVGLAGVLLGLALLVGLWLTATSHGR